MKETNHKQSYVYWIHRPEHTDITTQGYIGITVHPKYRWWEHRYKSNKGGKAVVYCAMRKHDDVVMTVLLTSTREYCAYIEQSLRPTMNIGWNIAIGGDDSTTSATVKSQQSYAKKRKERADYYWYKSEILLLKQLHKAKQKEIKEESRKAYIPHVQTRTPKVDNKLGVLGVSYFKKYDKYRSQICINYKLITIGYYPTIEDAKQAYELFAMFKKDIRVGQATVEQVRSLVTMKNLNAHSPYRKQSRTQSSAMQFDKGGSIGIIFLNEQKTARTPFG